MVAKKKNKKKTVDPLYTLFEHYVVTRSYENAGEFARQLAEEYLLYLDSTPAHTPFEARGTVLEDLASEAHEMLVKKLYGCVDASEYENQGVVLAQANPTPSPTATLFQQVLPELPERTSKNK